jgi:transposase
VLNRFLADGPDAVALRTAPGRRRTITAAWESELLRVMEMDPHKVGIVSANWTTQLLADYLDRRTGITVSQETVRLYLHAHGYVCKRPTWTLGRKAGEQVGYVGKRLRVEVLLAGAAAPEPLPIEFLVEADLWSQLPADVPDLLALLPRADLYLQDEVQFAFHPTLTRVWRRIGRRGQRLVEAPGENRTVYGFGLVDWRDGWFDGRIAPGRTADIFCEQVRLAVTRSKQRGRIALIIVDNLKTHTPTGSLLVRSMEASLKEHLRLIYTPAYDPEANRIEWLWRVSRRVVTHNHQRSTFELLVADVEQHFQTLAQTPASVLRHIGSPFAPEKSEEVPLPLAHVA